MSRTSLLRTTTRPTLVDSVKMVVWATLTSLSSAVALTTTLGMQVKMESHRYVATGDVRTSFSWLTHSAG